MKNPVNCDRKTNSGTDGCYAADGLEFIRSLSMRVEYYRSFEYNLKWKMPMPRRRSYRIQKVARTSPQRNTKPNKQVQKQSLRSKKQSRHPKKANVNASINNKDEDRDILDIINSTNVAKNVAKEDEEKFVEVADEGVGESDDDVCSVTSIASGPSSFPTSAAVNQGPSQGMCSACQNLYQRAEKMKRPIKNKLKDNDPKSLTCDQWVLIKTWRPSRLPNARGELMDHLTRIEKRFQVMKHTKRTEVFNREDTLAFCWRPNIFLKRNLKRCVRVKGKKERKKNRGKRRRDSSQGPRAAKQQRLHNSNNRQHISTDCFDDDSLPSTSTHCRSPGFKGQSEHEKDDSADMDVTVELIPARVTLENPTKPIEVPSSQTAPRKVGFRYLLAQFLGSSNKIVRETS